MVKNLDDVDLELTPLTKKQILKFEAIKNHVNDQFEADNENARAIFNQFRRFEVIIVQNWDSSKKEYQVFNTQNNDELTGSILDQKLNEIMEYITQSKRTLPHAKPTNDGKFKSITSSTFQKPDRQFLESVCKELKEEMPLEVRIAQQQRAMQTIYPKFENLDMMEQNKALIYFQTCAREMERICAETFKVKKAKAFERLNQEQVLRNLTKKAKVASQKTKVEKPTRVKISKEDQSVWNLLKPGATQEQFQAKKKQMIELGILKIAEPTIVDGEKVKFKIETTSSKEETYNGDKS